MLNVFLLLTAYYVIKPVREALILAEASGAEYKAYMNGAIAIALLGAVPAYARFADRLPRVKLVVGVTLFFAANLVVFYWLGTTYRAALGLALSLGFYLWVGVFNMMVVAQFWAFANDIYTEEQGKRLFPFIGLGASGGAALGSTFSGELIPVLGIFTVLLLGAALLVACAGLFWLTDRREQGAARATPAPVAARRERAQGAFQMVLKEPYIAGLALFALVFSCVNSNGEYLLGKLVKQAASDAVAHGTIALEATADYIGAIYGRFFLIVNVLGVFLQAFVVSRVVRLIGIGRALFILPVIAMGDALAVALLPVLAVIRIGKIAENATDYSLNNTLRQMLWLVTTREQKYKAKQAVDTFFVRMGDVVSSLLVWLLASQASFTVRQFSLVNAALVAVWLYVVIGVARGHRRLERQEALVKAASVDGG